MPGLGDRRRASGIDRSRWMGSRLEWPTHNEIGRHERADARLAAIGRGQRPVGVIVWSGSGAEAAVSTPWRARGHAPRSLLADDENRSGPSRGRTGVAPISALTAPPCFPTHPPAPGQGPQTRDLTTMTHACATRELPRNADKRPCVERQATIQTLMAPPPRRSTKHGARWDR